MHGYSYCCLYVLSAVPEPYWAGVDVNVPQCLMVDRVGSQVSVRPYVELDILQAEGSA